MIIREGQRKVIMPDRIPAGGSETEVYFAPGEETETARAGRASETEKDGESS